MQKDSTIVFTPKVPSCVEAGAAARAERVVPSRAGGRARGRTAADGRVRVATLLLGMLSLVLRRHILLKRTLLRVK